MSKRIVVFNHKGGVSKTTSTYNIGWMISQNHRVLLVDGDAQCNLTSLILGDRFDDYYLNDDTRLHNIKDGVSPAFEGRPAPIECVNCPQPARAPNLYLLPGHANLSEYDAALTFAQTSNNAISTLQNLPGSFARLLKLTEEHYNIDYTIIDLNPSLSSINQNLFLISNGFIIPTNPDPFSVMALETLSRVLPRWSAWKTNAAPLFARSAYPMPDEGTTKFIGSLIQRFNIRNGQAASPFRNNISEIKSKIRDGLFPALTASDMVFAENYYETIENYCLGEIPDFQGLLPKAHAANVPVFELTDLEIGEVGNVLHNFIEKRGQFRDQFSNISDKIMQAMEHE